MHTVAFIVYPGFQLLDATGPASVFAEFVPTPTFAGYRIRVMANGAGTINSSSGIGIATEDLSSAGVDTLIIVGSDAAPLRKAIGDLRSRDTVLDAHARGVRIASVCTGAFALAEWGVLDGRSATTHWAAAKHFRSRFPEVTLHADRLFEESRGVWTSAGVSSGIDMALALVCADAGREASNVIARRLVLQSHRTGQQPQLSATLLAQSSPYAALTEWITANLASELTLDTLAAHAGQTPRTLHRGFVRTLGMSPTAFVKRVRLDYVRAGLTHGRKPTSLLKNSGFNSLDRLGKAFQREFGFTLTAYAQMHGAATR